MPRPAADWKTVFHGIDKLLKVGERVPGAGVLRRRAVKRAGAWMIERLAESEGLSAILPAMANSALALSLLGYSEKHPLLAEALGHLDGLLLRDEDGLRMQPCLSPVWDTVLATHALLQGSLAPDDPAVARAVAWLLGKQTQRPGDWAVRNPAPPGGWYFEGKNEFYPDVDDTCMALMVLAQARAGGTPEARGEAMRRGLAWMMGMQNEDGGWASFDRGNDKHWLTAVPFADHNAMIDPSTADITARVLESSEPPPRYSSASPTRPSCARSVSPPRSDHRGVLVRPLGGQLPLRHLAGAARARAPSARTCEAPYVRRAVRWLLGTAERRRRLGREHRQLRPPGAKGDRPLDAQPDGLGDHGARRCGRAAQRGRQARRPPPPRAADSPTGPGSSSPGPGPASRRFFISTIITTGTTSRSWRCRSTARRRSDGDGAGDAVAAHASTGIGRALANPLAISAAIFTTVVRVSLAPSPWSRRICRLADASLQMKALKATSPDSAPPSRRSST